MILVSPAPWRKIIRNQGAKCSSGGNLKKEKIMNLHLGAKQWICTQRLGMEHWNMRVSKRVLGQKSKLRATDNSSSSHGLHPLAWSSTKRTTSEALTSEIPTLRHPRLKSTSGWWSTLILTLQDAIITLLHRRPVRIMHIIHNMHTLAFICCEILALYGKRILVVQILYY